jgi:tetratricopeptide (TPR) repeat protein
VFNHSWNLLTDGEQQVLRKLSVFRGGWDEDAADKVAGASVYALVSLVDKSLLRRDAAGRFSVHEMVRQYAAEQLQAMPGKSGEQDETQAAHAACFLELAERAHEYLSGPDTETWLTVLDREHGNFRAALHWTRGSGHEPSIGLRMAAALWPFWFLRGYYREGREQLEAVLSGAPGDEASRATRTKALNGAGTLAWRLGDYGAARSFYEESLDINRELGDERGISQSLHNLGLVVYSQGNYRAARSINEEVLAIHRAMGDKDRIARSLANLAMVAKDQGDHAAARSIYEESLALGREVGDRRNVSAALSGLGEIARFQGDYAAARSLFEESLAIRRELGEEGGIALMLNNLGSVAYFQGDYTTALSLYEQALAMRRKLGDKNGIAASLCNLGSWAYSQGDYATAGARYKESLVLQRELSEKPGTIRCLVGLGGVAVGGRQSPAGGEAPEPILPTADRLLPTAYVGAKLFGAAEALLETIGAVMDPADGMIYEQGVASARAQLGEEEFERVRAEGRAMSLEQAIGHALELLPEG